MGARFNYSFRPNEPLKQFGTRSRSSRGEFKVFPEDFDMTRNKLALVISLILGVGMLAGGIVYAQQALDSPELTEMQEPGTAPRSFSLFVDGGAFLGVSAEEINKENFSRYGLREVRGVGVTRVFKDSPAEKAG